MIRIKSSLWESGHEGAFTVLNCFWSYISANENAYLEGDRKLHGLSEYVISFKKMSFYSHDICKIRTAAIFFQGNRKLKLMMTFSLTSIVY